jgi:hypothetical protein
MPDCLFVLSKLEPWLFSDRGLANLERLASDEARAFDYSDDPSVLLISYAGSSPEPQYILVERRSVMNREGTRQYWRSVFEYAQTEGGGDLDAMIARRKAFWGAS